MSWAAKFSFLGDGTRTTSTQSLLGGTSASTMWPAVRGGNNYLLESRELFYDIFVFSARILHLTERARKFVHGTPMRGASPRNCQDSVTCPRS